MSGNEESGLQRSLGVIEGKIDGFLAGLSGLKENHKDMDTRLKEVERFTTRATAYWVSAVFCGGLLWTLGTLALKYIKGN
jgi:hypothetical protein